jgi:hypothetical protein
VKTAKRAKGRRNGSLRALRSRGQPRSGLRGFGISLTYS